MRGRRSSHLVGVFLDDHVKVRGRLKHDYGAVLLLSRPITNHFCKAVGQIDN